MNRGDDGEEEKDEKIKEERDDDKDWIGEVDRDDEWMGRREG